MSKKLLISSIILGTKSISGGYLFKMNNFNNISNFDYFVKKLTNENCKKNIIDDIKKNIINNYKELKNAYIKEIDLKCGFNINIYDDKKYISEIKEKENLVFGDFNEINNDGITETYKKNFIVILSKIDNNTIKIKLFKNIPENKKIDKDGKLVDNIVES